MPHQGSYLFLALHDLQRRAVSLLIAQHMRIDTEYQEAYQVKHFTLYTDSSL